MFAINNGTVDYVKMASWSASRIARWLNLPVTLITNQTVIDSVFDQVIVIESRDPTSKWYHDFDQSMPWYNGNRVDVYSLSPYQQTLVLDTDYVVASSQLLTLFESKQDFLCHNWAIDVSNSTSYEQNNYFGRGHMPMTWATVMYYRRSAQAQSVFDMMTMIKDNWSHYRNLYGILNPTYRNDFALSIALNVLGGHQAQYPSIPWNMINVDPDRQLKQLDTDQFEVSWIRDQRKYRTTIACQDFHAMCKKDLGAIIGSNQ